MGWEAPQSGTRRRAVMSTRLADYPVAVVGFVGPSGVGKTTLLERLVEALSRRGLAVAAVKHASHGFLADRPGKDSYRLYEAGAEAVAVAGAVVTGAVVVPRSSATGWNPSGIVVVLGLGLGS